MSCTVSLSNMSGVAITSVALWHTPGEPEINDLTVGSAIFAQAMGENQEPLRATIDLPSSMTDYWTLVVQYAGDGATYILAGDTGAPYKEFEVSQGSTMDFYLNAWKPASSQTLQFLYNNGNPPNGCQLFQPAQLAALGLVETLTHIAADLAAE